MSTITLIVIPGPGARTVTLPQGATVTDLVQRESLFGRDIIINGVSVLPTNYSTTVIESNMEIFATASVKGN